MNTPPHDLWSPTHRANPRRVYQWLREHARITRLYDPLRKSFFWLVTRYDDVMALVRDGRFIKDLDKVSAEMGSRFYGVKPDLLSRHMPNMDPPNHSRL